MDYLAAIGENKKMANDSIRIDHIFNYMEYDYLTDSQHDLLVSFEEQYDRKGSLSDDQYEILEDIFKKVA
jgi:hypothetical protein